MDWRPFDRAERLARADERAAALRLIRGMPRGAFERQWQADFAARVEAARARRLGLSVERYRQATLDAARLWCAHWPWRHLPRWLARQAFRRWGARAVGAALQSEVNRAT